MHPEHLDAVILENGCGAKKKNSSEHNGFTYQNVSLVGVKCFR
jgi:hypothetical protein